MKSIVLKLEGNIVCGISIGYIYQIILQMQNIKLLIIIDLGNFYFLEFYLKIIYQNIEDYKILSDKSYFKENVWTISDILCQNLIRKQF